MTVLHPSPHSAPLWTKVEVICANGMLGRKKKDHNGHLNFVLCAMDKLIYKFKEARALGGTGDECFSTNQEMTVT